MMQVIEQTHMSVNEEHVHAGRHYVHQEIERDDETQPANSADTAN